MADDTKVRTVFEGVDQTSPKYEQMAKGAEKAARAAEKAERAAKGALGAGSTAHGGAGGGGGGHRTPGAVISDHEREEILQAREEMKLRKARMKVQKVEMQKEQVLHRVAETALLSVIGEENKAAAALAKFGATAQTMGTSMTAFGGTLGKIGSTLANVGGVAGMAGLALEGIVTVAKALGVNVEEIEEGVKDWALHLVGMKSDKSEAIGKGFRSAADMKAAREIMKTIDEEQELNRSTALFSRRIRDMPTAETSAAMDLFRGEMMAEAKRISVLENIDLGKAYKALEEASKNSIAGMAARTLREHEVEEVMKKHREQIERWMPSLNADMEERKGSMVALRSIFDQMVANGQLTEEEARQRFQNISGMAAEESSRENVIAAYNRQMRDQDLMEAQSKRQVNALARMIPPLTATPARLAKFHDELMKAAAHMAEVSHWTPEQTQQYLQKLSEAATEKQKVLFDFRNSRFDIMQQFAAGFDPDRIAVAFTSDLARVGEFRGTSQHSPRFARR